MGFQQTVNLTQAFGVQGEIIYDGPVRSNPWQLISTPQANIIGATAYTITSPGTDTGSGTAQAGSGGTGFAGVLAAPKSYANFSGSLAPTLTLPDDTIGELVTMGTINLLLGNIANPGDLLYYDNTTGALGSIAPITSFTGVIAVTTGILTTSALTSGAVYAGMPLSGAGVPPGTIVTTNIDATHWNTNIITAVASTVMTGPSAAPAGKSFVPHGKVILRQSAANGIAICELTD